MSEADDNRRKQSEALGRVLAEAMDGDRLHPDNQPQVGTCPRCGSDNPEVCYANSRGVCWNGVGADRDPWHDAQPTPAEPRSETLTMKQLKKAVEKCRGEGQHNCYLGNRLAVHEIMGTRARQKAGAQPAPEERAELVANISSALTAVSRDHMSVGNALQLIIDEIKTYDAGRARAGLPSDEIKRLRELLRRSYNFLPFDSEERISIEQEIFVERASPPSSLGAAQTQPKKIWLCGSRPVFCDNPELCTEQKRCVTDATPGAPQEQK